MKVGDRVRVTDYSAGVPPGTEGTVVYLCNTCMWGATGYLAVGVDFGKGFNGYTLGGTLDDNTGCFAPDKSLEVI